MSEWSEAYRAGAASCEPELSALRAENEALKAERDAIRADAETWDDVDDEHTAAVLAAHPTRVDTAAAHARYGVAMAMIRTRYSKHQIVSLVNWLLAERDGARAEVMELRGNVAGLEYMASVLESQRNAAPARPGVGDRLRDRFVLGLEADRRLGRDAHRQVEGGLRARHPRRSSHGGAQAGQGGMSKLVLDLVATIRDRERQRDAAISALTATRDAASLGGREGTCASAPGDAWAIVCQDRDLWKQTAIDAEERAVRAERLAAEARTELDAVNARLAAIEAWASGLETCGEAGCATVATCEVRSELSRDAR